jgi:hypothetical protein
MATLGGSAPPCSSSAKGRPLGGGAEDVDLLHTGLGGRLTRLVEERRHRHEQPRARILQLLGQLVGGVERIGGGGDAAERRDAEEHQAVLGQVRAVEREHVALAEAARSEARGHALHALGQLPVREGAAAGAVDQRRLVAEPDGVAQDVVGDGLLGNGDAATRGDHGHPREAARAMARERW